MKTNAINNTIFNAKFIAQKPKISDIRIHDGQKLLTKIPEFSKEVYYKATKEIVNTRNGKLTEKTLVKYGNPEKECFVYREVINSPNDDYKVSYKKITRLNKEKGGFRYLIQTLKDDVYSSECDAHKPFGFDSKQDKLPKSVIGSSKMDQKTFYTKQPKFFKGLYIKALTKLITDKNGCEKTNSKLFNHISQIINNNIRKEPIKMI